MDDLEMCDCCHPYEEHHSQEMPGDMRLPCDVCRCEDFEAAP